MRWSRVICGTRSSALASVTSVALTLSLVSLFPVDVFRVRCLSLKLSSRQHPHLLSASKTKCSEPQTTRRSTEKHVRTLKNRMLQHMPLVKLPKSLLNWLAGASEKPLRSCFYGLRRGVSLCPEVFLRLMNSPPRRLRDLLCWMVSILIVDCSRVAASSCRQIRFAWYDYSR